MKNRLQNLAILLLVLALSLTACSSPEKEPEPTPVSTATPAETTAAPTVRATASATVNPTPAQTEEPTEPEIIVDELVDVDNLMINESLDDDGWWNILLLGSDTRKATNKYGRTDNIIILSVHPANHKAKLTSLMRDTWVDIYGVGMSKLNAANVYGGPELAMRTVNESFGMNISNYVLVGMEALVDIIDLVGGVDLSVTEKELDAINQQLIYDAADFALNDDTPLAEFGENVHLTGNQALAYARIRMLDNDYVRSGRQRAVLLSIAKQLQSSNASDIMGIIDSLVKYVQTNLTLNQMLSLATVGLTVDLNSTEQLRLPADGTFESGKFDGIWCIRPDFAQNQELLHDFIYGAPSEK